MNDIVQNNDPLWFLNESSDLIEYKEGGLAEQIFALADARMQRNRKVIVSTIIGSSQAASELVEGMKKTQRLKVVFTDEIKEKLKDGTYSLMKKKDEDGVFKAIVVDAKGKIKAQADLKWEDVCKGVDPSKITSAMQGMAIQQQLKDIAGQLEDMSVSMEEILVGQHNDRLALFYSGEAVYREALATSDPERKKQLASAAILELTNAVASLQTTLALEINGICDKYDQDKEKFIGIKSDKLREKMFIINSSFQTIHKAMALKAAIYYNEGEYAALTVVLSDYKAFLERSLSDKNAHILYLADPNEKNLDGTWNIRQNELPQKIENTKELLMKASEYELEADKEDIA
jgi:hypothetical protein